MTTVTFVFITLFSWIVSSGTWLSQDQCTELSHYGHVADTKGFISSTLYKNAVIHDKTKLTLTCERSHDKSLALDRIFTENRFTDCGFVKPLDMVKEAVDGEEQNGHVYKCKIQQSLEYYWSRTSFKPILLTVQIKTDNHSTYLNDRSTCASSVLLRSAALCCHIVPVDHQKTMHAVCICKTQNLKVKLLHGVFYKEFNSAFPPSLIILTESQVNQMSSEESRDNYIRICHFQMPSKFYATHHPKEAFPTHEGKVESAQPDTHGWAGGFFLIAVLLLGTYMTRRKISSHSVSAARDSNSAKVMLLNLTLRCFSPSLTMQWPSEWSHIAVGISFMVYLSCALGTTVHVSLACRAVHTAMKLFYLTPQKFRALPFTALFLWLTCSPPFPNKTVKHWFEDIFVEGSVGATLRSWAMFGQMEFMATLYCLLISLTALLQSILTKVIFLTLLLHVHMVTSLQNSRVPTKYVLIIRINRLM